MTTIRLWDLPTRLFHWLLVLAVVGSVATTKMGGSWMAWHERLGLAVVGLLSFRLLWGFAGPTYARFRQFVPGPGAVVAYLRGQWQGVGHNPLGALSVIALMGVFGFQAVTGLFANDDIAFNGPLYRLASSDWSDTLSGWHRQAEWYLYGLVALHVLAVLYYVGVKKDNLMRPMVTGRKTVADELAADARGGGWIVFVIAVAVSVGVVWVADGGLVPPPPPTQDLGW